jgi:hypothetical protein
MIVYLTLKRLLFNGKGWRQFFLKPQILLRVGSHLLRSEEEYYMIFKSIVLIVLLNNVMTYQYMC